MESSRTVLEIVKCWAHAAYIFQRRVADLMGVVSSFACGCVTSIRSSPTMAVFLVPIDTSTRSPLGASGALAGTALDSVRAAGSDFASSAKAVKGPAARRGRNSIAARVFIHDFLLII